MDSRAVFAGVQAKADGGIGMVGKFCAPIDVDRCIRFARGDDLDSPSGEKGTEADIEREVDGFFQLTAVEMSTSVIAAMGSIEDYDKAGGGG